MTSWSGGVGDPGNWLSIIHDFPDDHKPRLWIVGDSIVHWAEKSFEDELRLSAVTLVPTQQPALTAASTRRGHSSARRQLLIDAASAAAYSHHVPAAAAATAAALPDDDAAAAAMLDGIMIPATAADERGGQQQLSRLGGGGGGSGGGGLTSVEDLIKDSDAAFSQVRVWTCLLSMLC